MNGSHISNGNRGSRDAARQVIMASMQRLHELELARLLPARNVCDPIATNGSVDAVTRCHRLSQSDDRMPAHPSRLARNEMNGRVRTAYCLVAKQAERIRQRRGFHRSAQNITSANVNTNSASVHDCSMTKSTRGARRKQHRDHARPPSHGTSSSAAPLRRSPPRPHSGHRPRSIYAGSEQQAQRRIRKADRQVIARVDDAGAVESFRSGRKHIPGRVRISPRSSPRLHLLEHE